MKSDLVGKAMENKALIFEIEKTKRNRDHRITSSSFLPAKQTSQILAPIEAREVEENKTEAMTLGPIFEEQPLFSFEQMQALNPDSFRAV